MEDYIILLGRAGLEYNILKAADKRIGKRHLETL